MAALEPQLRSNLSCVLVRLSEVEGKVLAQAVHSGGGIDRGRFAAQERGLGIFGMKIFGNAFLLRTFSVMDCLRCTLSLPVSAAVLGFSTPGQLEDGWICAVWGRSVGGDRPRVPEKDKVTRRGARPLVTEAGMRGLGDPASGCAVQIGIQMRAPPTG